jgi:hypothetical protein
MSESMAFIGGVAVAGLAALVLLKGTVSPAQTGFIPQQIQPQQAMPQMMPQAGQYPYGGQPVVTNPIPNAPNNDQLRLDNERVKMQMDNLQRDNDRLKAENQQLNFQLQNFSNQQLKAIQDQSNPQRAAQLPSSSSPWWSSGIVWAVGGMALTIGGGVVVAGVSALFSPKQRPVRTVQVIHPYNGPTPPLANTTRRAEFLPPRAVDSRRVESPEYDETY